MMIWDIRSEGAAPQHVGSDDGMGDLRALVANARKAGHYAVAAARVSKGNDAMTLIASDVAFLDRFFATNPIYRVNEMVEA